MLSALDGGMTKRAAHQTFGISRTTIDAWLTLRAQTGHVHANTTYRRGTAPAIADHAAFRAFAQRQCHHTLEQMAAAWEQETGHKLSTMTFSTMLRRSGWTRKKRVTCIKSVMRLPANSSVNS